MNTFFLATVKKQKCSENKNQSQPVDGAGLGCCWAKPLASILLMRNSTYYIKQGSQNAEQQWRFAHLLHVLAE